MKYFYTQSINSDKKIGPLSLDEMLKLKFKQDTIVWREGFEDWKNIMDVEELKASIIIPEILILPPKTPFEKKQDAISNLVLAIIYIYFIASIIIFLIVSIKQTIKYNDNSFYRYRDGFVMLPIPYYLGIFACSLLLGVPSILIMRYAKSDFKDKIYLTILLYVVLFAIYFF